MKAHILLKQKNLLTGAEQILCDGPCNILMNDSSFEFSYDERKPYNGRVRMYGSQHQCRIQRIAENVSMMNFCEKTKTKGTVSSVYGKFDVDIYTHVYHMNDKVIALEYDILNDVEVIEKYRIMAKIKKVV